MGPVGAMKDNRQELMQSEFYYLDLIFNTRVDAI